MPKEIAMPTSPNFTRSTFSLSRAVGMSISPFTGQQKTQEYDYAGWSAEVALPPMKRATAAEWQAWLARLKGSTNYFQFGDPDAATGRGTYDGATFTAQKRIDFGTDSKTLTFATADNSIVCTGGTGTTSLFGTDDVNAYMHVTGAVNEANNGTHKVTYASATKVITQSTLVAESNTAGCKVRQNVKGSTGLSMIAVSSNTGTLLAGDYLSILDSSSAASDPVQLVMVTEVGGFEDATPDKYNVAIEPKLRAADITDGYHVRFVNPKGYFRLASNVVDWTANKNSVYSLSFAITEVI